MKSNLKILFVGNFSRDWNDEVGIAEAFESLGHSVKRMEEKETNDLKLIEEADTGGHDLLFYNKFRISGDRTNALGKIKIPKVCWFFDLYIGTPREGRLRKEWARMADCFFSTDGGHQGEFEAIGIKNIYLNQGIQDRFAFIGKKVEKMESKVLFVGNITPWCPSRQKFIDFMDMTYKRGFMWPRRSVRGTELNDMVASAKITVGHNVPSPRYWSNRIYEMIGRGGFFISPRAEGLEEEFVDGEHAIFYEPNNYRDLKEKVDWYLAHDEEREKIRLAGFERCRERFTYKSRCGELLEKVYA